MTNAHPSSLRLGSGAGYSGDRIDPAVELARDGDIDYLIFECLAERTIALAQQERLHHPDKGYDPLLTDRMQSVLPLLFDSTGQRRFRIISNMGAANPIAAAKQVCSIAKSLGITGLNVAAVTGDDVLEQLRTSNDLLDNGQTPAQLGDKLVSANAYLGAAGIVEAIHADADIILTGRVADPALFLAPLLAEFKWAWDDWAKLGTGTLVGHLLECAGQVSGGYFADPGVKDVSNLARLGFPIAQVSADGDVLITKVKGSGGQITVQTCTEQLLYEIHDPSRYLTPDVIADFSKVRFSEQAVDEIHAEGANGQEKSGLFKVSVGYLDGYLGEGQISYGGPNALARATLARDIVLERIAMLGLEVDDLHADLIGMNSLYGNAQPPATTEPQELRLRIAGRCANPTHAKQLGNEVEALYTNGPAGGGGASKSTRQVVAVASLLWPSDRIPHSVHMETVA